MSNALNTFEQVIIDGCAVKVTDETHVLAGFIGVVIGQDDHHVGVDFGDVVVPIERESLIRVPSVNAPAQQQTSANRKEQEWTRTLSRCTRSTMP